METHLWEGLSWREQVEKWKLKYKVSAKRPPTTNLTELTLRKCKRCNSRDEVHRHHKGNEYFFALKWPDRYAERYVRFRKKDTIDLCSECHGKIHELYLPTIRELFNEFETKDGKLSKFRCDYYIGRFTDKCNSWMRKGDKNTKRKSRLRPTV